jgi:hypothetical protein
MPDVNGGLLADNIKRLPAARPKQVPHELHLGKEIFKWLTGLQK